MSTDVLKTHEEQLAFVESALEKAESLRKKKEYGEAISLLVEALRYGINKAKIYFRLGNTYVDGGDLARAEYAYKRALDMDPHYINAMHNLAIVYRRQKKISLYVKTYKKSQRLSIKRPHKTGLSPEQKTHVRGLSRRVAMWLFGGLAAVAIVVWLLTRS